MNGKNGTGTVPRLLCTFVDRAMCREKLTAAAPTGFRARNMVKNKYVNETTVKYQLYAGEQ
jgi:hypothetical protein